MKQETPEDVRQWFLAEVEKLWPVVGGSLSLCKNRCIRKNCWACQSGEGHPAYALHTRTQGRQSSVYVPDDLARTVEAAVRKREKLKSLLVEAGVRYVKALKAQRRGR
jgi:hypothetical protein